MEDATASWTATYRLQLNSGFKFDDLAAIARYLADLGVSHVYLSPILQAAPGSTHGYDVADPTHINRELGGEHAYDRASEELRRLGLGQLVDIVPNHMAAHDSNPWWWDVLRRGPASPYASYFDLRWHGTPPRISLPVLGADLGEVARKQELRLEAGPEEEQALRYYERRFPLAPQSYVDSRQIAAVNADSQELLNLVEAQHYRLVHWRTSASKISYRRFFDISGLVGMRAEDERVFNDSHRLLLDLVSHGKIGGLRIDHVDGLRDPKAYLTRLRQSASGLTILVEKILEADERLPEIWPVQGTTGYDYVNVLNGLFVDPAAEQPLTRLYQEVTGETRDYAAVLREKKQLVLYKLFAGDLSHLAGLFEQAARSDVWARDEIEKALGEAIVALSVYRTYVQPERRELSNADGEYNERALAQAKMQCGRQGGAILERLSELLRLERTGQAKTEFVLAFQQLTGPVMAKGAEDTAFYCYNRLVSLNEVGGDPGHFGLSLDAFHAFCSQIAERWPGTMVATSTHDTKRGEDVRLRIDALSEAPEEWAGLVREWTADHEQFCTEGQPDSNTRYLLYQTLAGSWPIEEGRVQEYMLKAAREAKLQTSWTEVNETYETALRSFISALLSDIDFTNQCAALAEPLRRRQRIASLSQTLLKLTVPGVPDIYQGAELWDSSLVDPDNRRPVDYDVRRRLLDEAKQLDSGQALARMEEGLTKMWLTERTLALRRARPELFTAPYEPLYAEGAKRDCVVAFIRGGRLIAVAPRLVARVERGWADTMLTLPQGTWRSVLAESQLPGGTVRLDDLLSDFPVALLVSEGAQ